MRERVPPLQLEKPSRKVGGETAHFWCPFWVLEGRNALAHSFSRSRGADFLDFAWPEATQNPKNPRRATLQTGAGFCFRFSARSGTESAHFLLKDRLSRRACLAQIVSSVFSFFSNCFFKVLGQRGACSMPPKAAPKAGAKGKAKASAKRTARSKEAARRNFKNS